MAAGLAAYGTSVTFQTGYLAYITSVNFSGRSRDPLDTTNMASTSGWETMIPSQIKKAGQLKCAIIWDPDKTPPIDQAAETVTVTFPIPTGKTNPATFQCSGFMTEFDATGEVNGLYTANVTLQFSGVPTYTASS
ncbi:MAG TPA: hypothetical protein VF175_09580 [Lacipirellula sp.]